MMIQLLTACLYFSVALNMIFIGLFFYAKGELVYREKLEKKTKRKEK
jgi:hypothetical protein